MHSDSIGNAAIGPVIAFAVVVGVIVAVSVAYITLCAYFATRADRLASATPADTPPPTAQEAVAMPFNWLVPAVVAVVLGFTPCAVASLVHASRVAVHHGGGRIVAARESARLARAWFWWSVAIGIALIMAFLALPLIAQFALR